MKKYIAVEEFLEDLNEVRRQQVQALRKIILSLDPVLAEHIKWNAPSYVFNGEDRITFNTHYPDKIVVLIHMGATKKEDKNAVPVMKDDSGLIQWNSDIRGTLSFSSIDEIQDNEVALHAIFKNWLAIL